MIIKPEGGLSDHAKTLVDMPKQNAAMFALFEELLQAMGLAYQLRCLKCNQATPGNDYCWGNNETNASIFVVECNCTRREYRGPGGPTPKKLATH